VPAQDRFRRDDVGELVEHATAEGHAAHREPTPIVVGESQASLAKLLPEDSVLIKEVVEDPLLVAVQPAGEDDGQDVEEG
jgi:hypothetical protein